MIYALPSWGQFTIKATILQFPQSKWLAEWFDNESSVSLHTALGQAIDKTAWHALVSLVYKHECKIQCISSN